MRGVRSRLKKPLLVLESRSEEREDERREVCVREKRVGKVK